MSEDIIGSIKTIVLNHNKSVQRGTYFVLKAVPKENIDFSPKENLRKISDLAFHLATLPLGFYLLTKRIIKELVVGYLIKQNYFSEYDNSH
ncbi:MAG: hypothetical protein HeimC3_18000 [Candidatus Heimdallarchaeota archaeon LC_3]|nr:MAG: hypothetical protein HeimC3_18000 [Candidatus Heimdallarchaeota archaeon LC_3]